MGKNYYCEYCDKSFRDVLAVRKNHLKGALHQQMKKEHFDRFRGKFAFRDLFFLPLSMIHCRFENTDPGGISQRTLSKDIEESRVYFR